MKKKQGRDFLWAQHSRTVAASRELQNEAEKYVCPFFVQMTVALCLD